MALLAFCLRQRDVARPFKLGRRARSGSLPARGSLRLRRRDPLASVGIPSLALVACGDQLAALVWRDEQNPLPFGKMQAMLHCARVEMAMARQLRKSRLAASGKLSRLTSRLIWLI